MAEPQSSASAAPGKTGLFRAQSLQQLDRPEDYTAPLRVTGRLDWFAALLCLALCLSVVAWACLARYRVVVEGPGVLVRGGGVFIGVNAPKSGWIDQLVAVDQKVEAGQLVASLTTPEEDARVSDLENRIAQIVSQRQAIVQRYELRMASEKQAQHRRREELEESVTLTQQRVQEAETTLSNREFLFSRGSGTVDRVQEGRERLFAAREALARRRSDIAALDSVIFALEGQRDQELESNHRQLLDLQGQLEQARLSRLLADEIRAPQGGVAVLVPVTVNTLVAAGQRLVTLETGSDRLEAVFFVPGDMGKRILPGMDVRLSPTTAPREEYGTLQGRVVSISSQPEGQAEIAARLGNPELARTMAQNGTPFEVHALLDAPAGDPRGYAWTSERGAEIDLSSGLMLNASVTVRRAPPITLVIPALRRWTGL